MDVGREQLDDTGSIAVRLLCLGTAWYSRETRCARILGAADVASNLDSAPAMMNQGIRNASSSPSYRSPRSMIASADLMARYQRGDAQAFRELYALVAHPLRMYLVKRTRDRALAEDLLQVTFLKIHRARGAYLLGANPVPWFYTIAHRTFVDEARRKRCAIVDTAGENLPEVVADLNGDAANRCNESRIDPDLLRGAAAALSTLPARQREAVVLTKLHGRSVAEVARIAGTTTSAIKARLHRAYVALRCALAARQTLGAAA